MERDQKWLVGAANYEPKFCVLGTLEEAWVAQLNREELARLRGPTRCIEVVAPELAPDDYEIDGLAEELNDIWAEERREIDKRV